MTYRKHPHRTPNRLIENYLENYELILVYLFNTTFIYERAVNRIIYEMIVSLNWRNAKMVTTSLHGEVSRKTGKG